MGTKHLRPGGTHGGYSLAELLVGVALLSVGVLAMNQFFLNHTNSLSNLSNSEDSIARIIIPVEKFRSDLKVAKRIYKDSTNLNANNLAIEYDQLDSATQTMSPRKVLYESITAGNIFRRSLLDPSTGTVISTVDFPGIVAFTWCIDDGSSPSTCPVVGKPYSSAKRAITQFSYTTASAQSVQTLQFIADIENSPFDCRTVNDPMVAKEGSL